MRWLTFPGGSLFSGIASLFGGGGSKTPKPPPLPKPPPPPPKQPDKTMIASDEQKRASIRAGFASTNKTGGLLSTSDARTTNTLLS